MTDAYLQDIYVFAIELARRAGREIKLASDKRYSGETSKLDLKINSVDLVTETDQRVEELIKAAISEKYPGHKFLGEESYAAGQRPELTDEPTWIVDPIDGTTNFVHGFPFCCTSIGFCINKVPTIGVVYNPFLDHLYHGLKGQGSFLNKEKLPLVQPKPLKSLGEALIGVEWGNLRSEDVMTKKANSFCKIAGDPKSIPGAAMAHSLRSTGSAALNFCFVAAGQLDAYWEIGCYAWDVCAGSVVASEAGGKCYGKNGGVFDGAAISDRFYFVIRSIAHSPEETGLAAQDRLSEEFHRLIDNWDP